MAEELARHDHQISPGSLCPTLLKMEAKGLFTSIRHIVDGRVRRCHVATAKGRRTLESTKRQLRKLPDGILGNPR